MTTMHCEVFPARAWLTLEPGCKAAVRAARRQQQAVRSKRRLSRRNAPRSERVETQPPSQGSPFPAPRSFWLACRLTSSMRNVTPNGPDDECGKERYSTRPLYSSALELFSDAQCPRIVCKTAHGERRHNGPQHYLHTLYVEGRGTSSPSYI